MKINELPTPCFVIDEKKMRENLEILKKVQEDTGCKILLAQKAFSGFALYPMIGKYLAGTTASGLFEARLGHEEMGKENHVFSPAYRTEDIEELDRIFQILPHLLLIDHIAGSLQLINLHWLSRPLPVQDLRRLSMEVPICSVLPYMDPDQILPH